MIWRKKGGRKERKEEGKEEEKEKRREESEEIAPLYFEAMEGGRERKRERAYVGVRR